MGLKLSVGECATRVYEAAREVSSDLTDLLERLETTVQTNTTLETKTKDGSLLSLLSSSLLTMDT